MARLLLLRRLFGHAVRNLLSLTGVAVGAALAVAVLGFLGSLTGSVERFVGGLAGIADLEVRAAASDAGFDQALLGRIDQVRGVEHAVPVMNSPVLVGGAPALLVGLDERATVLGGGLSESTAALFVRMAASGVFLGPRLAEDLGAGPGSEVRVVSRSGTRQVVVLGLVPGDGADFNEGRFALTGIPLAQQLVGRAGRLDSVLVVTGGGADAAEVAGRLSPLAGAEAVVESPNRRLDQARRATHSMRLGMQLGVGVGFIVGAFVIFNVMSMAAEERRRELATIRALGGSRGRLLGLFLAEAAVLALAGSAVGCVAGLGVSRYLVEHIPPALAAQVGVEVGFRLPGYAIPIGVVGSVAMALVAAVLPARRAVTVPPVEAMRPEGVEDIDRFQRVARGPAITGLVGSVVLSVVAVVGPAPLDLAAVWGLLATIIVATYGLAYPIARMAAACSNPAGATGRLAGSAVERAPRRAWAAGAAVAAATASVVAQAGIFDNLDAWITASFGHLDRVDLYVSAEDPNRPGADRELPGDWRRDLEAIPGIAHAGVHGSTSVVYRGHAVAVSGVEGSIAAEPAMAGATAAARARVEAGDGAIVSTRFSQLHGVGEGDRLTLPTPSGRRSVEVVGVVPSLVGEGELVTVGRGVLRDWFGRRGATEYLVTLSDGARPDAVRRLLNRFLSERSTPAFVTTGSAYTRSAYATLEQVRQLFAAMTWVIIGAAVLAIVNALLMSVLERRRELGILRALGTSRRQVQGMVALEAAAIGLVGGAIGSGVGLLMHRAGMEPILAPLAQQSAAPVEYQLVALPALLAVLLGVAIAAVGSLVPARRAARIDVVQAIGYE